MPTFLDWDTYLFQEIPIFDGPPKWAPWLEFLVPKIMGMFIYSEVYGAI